MENERQLKFNAIYAALAVVLVLIAVFAVTFAIQAHIGRVLSEEITETAGGTAAKLERGSRIFEMPISRT